MDFKFPDVGEGIHEGVIVKWHVKEGDEVKVDQVLCEIETDKAVVEIPSPEAGVIDKLYHKEGETVKVGETLVSYHKRDGAPTEPKAAPKEEAPAQEEKKEEGSQKEEQKDQGGVVGAIVDADSKPGGGPSGPLFDKIKKHKAGEKSEPAAKPAPVAEAKAEAPKATPSGEKAHEDEYGTITYEKPSQIRKATMKHLQKTKDEMIPVTQVHYVDVTELATFRKEINEKLKGDGVRFSFLPFIAMAVIDAVDAYPPFNASWSEEHQELMLKKYVNLGFAVDTEHGLMVPVVHNADKMEIKELNAAMAEVFEATKERSIKPDQLKGASITITNYGSVGSVIGTPIINHPNTCILGVGTIRKELQMVDGKVEEHRILPLALTYDHRVVDGADAARFLNKITEVLEEKEQFSSDLS